MYLTIWANVRYKKDIRDALQKVLKRWLNDVELHNDA